MLFGIVATLTIAVGLAAFIHDVWYSLQIRKYCHKVALLEGRMQEYLEPQDAAGGDNKFCREQIDKVINGDYVRYSDKELLSLGDIITRRRPIRIALVLTIIILIFITGLVQKLGL